MRRAHRSARLFQQERPEKDQYDIFKGSCALPLFCKPYVVDGIPCLDGGISDPVPVLKAFEDGCDKVVLILTRPVDQKREQKKDVMPARLLAKAYPKAAERLLDRYRAYNDGVNRQGITRSSANCSSSRRTISAACPRSARATRSCK